MSNLKASLDDIDHRQKDHIKRLIDWLLKEVMSSGGDGDATWVVKNLDLYRLRAFVQDECLSNKEQRHWIVSDVRPTKNGGKRFSLSNNQEALIITTDPEDIPSWSQCTITV